MCFSELTLKYEEQAMLKLRQLYHQYGYTQYHMSKFEEYEFYARNKSFLLSEHVLTFTDTDGKLLALKPDVTLSIIKNSQDTGNSLQKVYYNENVYRTAPTSHGYREIMQTGLECIGNLDDCSLCEVLELAARSLESIRGDYLLDLSHMGMVSGLLDAMNWTDREEILALVGEKNVPGIAALCQTREISQTYTNQLCELTELYGSPTQVLHILQNMIANEQMAEAFSKLQMLCSVLESYQDHLRLDFSIVNDMRYYNGIIFRGYLPGLASGVLSGGQYDNLLRRMGKSGQAIGFAVYLDQLERFPRPTGEYDVDVLLIYQDDCDPRKVAETARELRNSGKTVRVERSIPVGLRYRDCVEVK